MRSEPHLSVDKDQPFPGGGSMSELDPMNAVAQIHVPHGHHVSAQHHRGFAMQSSRRCWRVEAAGSAAGVLV